MVLRERNRSMLCAGKFCNFTGSDNAENVLLSGQPPAFDYWSDFMVRIVVFAVLTLLKQRVNTSRLSLLQKAQKSAMHADGSPSTSSWEGGEVYHTMVRSGDFCQNTTYDHCFVVPGVIWCSHLSISLFS